MTPSKRIYILVGTHKGGFLFTSDLDRKSWQVQGPFFKGTDVNYMIFDERNDPTIFACVNSTWWGPDVRFSKDFGENWLEPKSGLRFEEGSENKVKKAWVVIPGRENEPSTLYAGVDPGALFKSIDGGENWYEVKALTNHPTRDKWAPGIGGMMVHSICLHPTDANTLHVGIS
ncbi:MAG: exo-alpha-sialidase, partial [bacterium]